MVVGTEREGSIRMGPFVAGVLVTEWVLTVLATVVIYSRSGIDRDRLFEKKSVLGK